MTSSPKILRTALSALLAFALLGGLALYQAYPAAASPYDLVSVGSSRSELLVSSQTSSQTGSQSGAPMAGKDEVIYATLSADGTAKSTYVINHFDITKAGLLLDHGTYSEVTNLSTTAALVQQGNEVTTQVSEGDFYYKGTILAAQLPWNIAIAYSLNGKPINAKELAGASGRLELRIVTRANPGVNAVFFDNYMLQIQLSLPTEKVREVTAPDATIAQAGATRQVAFTVLPGKEADLHLSAQVTDFEMGAIQISALPFSMDFDLPDTSEMTDGLQQLSDAVGLINDGVGKLDSGIADMTAGGRQLASGSQAFSDGLLALSSGSVQLREGSAQFVQALSSLATQIRTTYDQMNAGLAAQGTNFGELASGLADLERTLAGLDTLLGQIDSVKQGIDATLSSLDNFASAFVFLPEQDIIDLQNGLAALDAMYLSAGPRASIATLIADYSSSAELAGTWPYLRPALDGLSTALGGLDTVSLRQQIGALQIMLAVLNGVVGDVTSLEGAVNQIEQLAAGYGRFDQGLQAYTKGVDSVASSYVGLNGGIQQFMGGVAQTSGATSQLYDGTSQLYSSMADMPATMTEQIEAFMADYDFSDFTPTSFTSAENKNVQLVQFVLMTESIKIAVPEPVAEPEPAPPTFWDRLGALFGL